MFVTNTALERPLSPLVIQAEHTQPPHVETLDYQSRSTIEVTPRDP